MRMRAVDSTAARTGRMVMAGSLGTGMVVSAWAGRMTDQSCVMMASCVMATGVRFTAHPDGSAAAPVRRPGSAGVSRHRCWLRSGRCGVTTTTGILFAAAAFAAAAAAATTAATTATAFAFLLGGSFDFAGELFA